MKSLRSILKRFLPRRSKEIPLYQIGTGTITTPGFRVSIRANQSADRVQIGNESMLGCSMVLERESGVIRIGDRTYIGASLLICAEKVVIGSDVLIAWGCTIVDHDSHSLDWNQRADDVRLWREGFLHGGFDQAAQTKNWSVVKSAPVVIGDKAWIGFNSIILKGVTIGEGAVVAAGSVVTKDVAPWTVAAGNPARMVKEIERTA